MIYLVGQVKESRQNLYKAYMRDNVLPLIRDILDNKTFKKSVEMIEAQKMKSLVDSFIYSLTNLTDSTNPATLQGILDINKVAFVLKTTVNDAPSFLVYSYYIGLVDGIIRHSLPYLKSLWSFAYEKEM